MNYHDEIEGQKLFEKIRAKALNSIDDISYHLMTDNDMNNYLMFILRVFF